MVVWLLVGILVQGTQVYTKPLGVFMNEDRCLEVQKYVMAQAPSPQINDDTICVKTNEMGGS